MKQLSKTCLLFVLFYTAFVFQVLAQTTPTAPKPPQLSARFAFYSPDGSHLLVTLCKYALGQRPMLSSCRPWRYYLADKRWEEIALTPDDPDWSIESATYSPDGKTIAATIVKCGFVKAEQFPVCPYLNYRLLMIDAATGKHRTIPSESSRFKPSFTPDGKGLVYWQLDNLQGVATGTTPYPARQAQTLYFTHNIHTMSLSDEQGHLAIKVKAQSPLAPPRVFPDGVRVTVAGNGVFGAVTTAQGVYSGIWGVTRYGVNADDSLLIGDLQTGEMHAYFPKGFPEKVVFDVQKLPGNSAEKIIYMHGTFHVIVSDLKAESIIKVTPEFRPDQTKNRRYILPVRHATFSPSGDSFAYVFGSDLAIAPLRQNTEIEIIERPIFTPVINPIR
ncbi:MAG: hypothetical protein Q7U13_11105 [Rhodoferax sp.]|nr:hypothetical protein [Rhodoferax sp.]